MNILGFTAQTILVAITQLCNFNKTVDSKYTNGPGYIPVIVIYMNGRVLATTGHSLLTPGIKMPK